MLQEGKGEGEGGEKIRVSAKAPLASPYCIKHQPDGTEKNCIPCRNARLAFEKERDKPKPTVSGIQNDPACKHHLPPKQCLECRKEVEA
jgi:hypothetical protein